LRASRDRRTLRANFRPTVDLDSPRFRPTVETQDEFSGLASPRVAASPVTVLSAFSCEAVPWARPLNTGGVYAANQPLTPLTSIESERLPD
jgi:hypothetical protein